MRFIFNNIWFIFSFSLHKLLQIVGIKSNWILTCSRMRGLLGKQPEKCCYCIASTLFLRKYFIFPLELFSNKIARKSFYFRAKNWNNKKKRKFQFSNFHFQLNLSLNITWNLILHVISSQFALIYLHLWSFKYKHFSRVFLWKNTMENFKYH